MADPLTSTFGRRAFRGTGRTDDYFPPPPDLDFLERPTFMAPGAGYNPKLDPQALVSAGFSPRNAMVLQGLRQQLHEQSAMEREYADTEKAMQGLATIDPSGKNFSKDLLAIFRNSPGAMRNPDVLKQADFISKFAGPAQWSVEDIEDPDIYQQAVKENWGNLSPQEAKRRANASLTQRSMRGELASLGMERTDLDKMKSWTQEDFLREKGRLMREAKASTTKPWYERIGKTAADDVRTAAKEAKALQDFEDEYAKVLVDNPTLTKDAYVKQFKGDPNYSSYKTRRLAESIPSLVQEYSLTPQEAAQVLGLGGMIPQGAAAQDPFADRTTVGAGLPEGPPAAPQSPAVAAQAPMSAPEVIPQSVSPADLKREDLAPAPVTFESMQQKLEAKAAGEKRKREEEFLSRQKISEGRGPGSEKWEEAKIQLLAGLDENTLLTLAPTFGPAQYEALKRMGKDLGDVAFTDTDGKKVTWSQALLALSQDPRIAQLQAARRGETPSAQSVTKDFSSLWGGKGK